MARWRRRAMSAVTFGGAPRYILRGCSARQFKEGQASGMRDVISTVRSRTLVFRAAAFALCVAIVQVLPQFASQSEAQSLWDQLQSNYGSGTATNNVPVERKPDQLDDLRPDSTPWRSDA